MILPFRLFFALLWCVLPLRAPTQAQLAGGQLASAQLDSQEESTPNPPLKKTELTYADRQAWREVLQWPESCEEAFDNREGTWSGLTFWQIAPRQHLVEIQCFLAAYQANNMYAFYDEMKSPPTAHLLTFTTYVSEDGEKIEQEQTTELAGLSEFDPKEHTLSIVTKNRGLGDCGSRATYKIQHGAAVLKEFRAKFDCDGKWQDPKQYKRIFPR